MSSGDNNWHYIHNRLHPNQMWKTHAEPTEAMAKNLRAKTHISIHIFLPGLGFLSALMIFSAGVWITWALLARWRERHEEILPCSHIYVLFVESFSREDSRYNSVENVKVSFSVPTWTDMNNYWFILYLVNPNNQFKIEKEKSRDLISKMYTHPISNTDI